MITATQEYQQQAAQFRPAPRQPSQQERYVNFLWLAADPGMRIPTLLASITRQEKALGERIVAIFLQHGEAGGEDAEQIFNRLMNMRADGQVTHAMLWAGAHILKHGPRKAHSDEVSI